MYMRAIKQDEAELADLLKKQSKGIPHARSG